MQLLCRLATDLLSAQAHTCGSEVSVGSQVCVHLYDITVFKFYVLKLVALQDSETWTQSSPGLDPVQVSDVRLVVVI